MSLWLNDRMTASAYITGLGSHLPGPPIANDEVADILGGADRVTARLRASIQQANGIRTRHYAMDTEGRTTALNEELAAHALRAALADRGLDPEDLGMLACATTQGDLLVPGFASMVHGRLGGGPMQLLTAQGVCASSIAALDAAVAKVRLGDHARAAVVGSELSSRWLHERRFTGTAGRGDAHFLRWMLSDGAGAAVVEFQPRRDAPSLRVDWVRLVSHAHEQPVCMRAGLAGPVAEAGRTWQDQEDLAAAERAGMLQIRQDTAMLPRLTEMGLAEFERLVDHGLVDLRRLDHVICHYSTHAFRDLVFDALAARIPGLDESRWYSNLATRGNTGAASIFIALEEAWREGRFAPGESILLAVPESGRFSVGFAHLTVVAPRTPRRTA